MKRFISMALSFTYILCDYLWSRVAWLPRLALFGDDYDRPVLIRKTKVNLTLRDCTNVRTFGRLPRPFFYAFDMIFRFIYRSRMTGTVFSKTRKDKRDNDHESTVLSIYDFSFRGITDSVIVKKTIKNDISVNIEEECALYDAIAVGITCHRRKMAAELLNTDVSAFISRFSSSFCQSFVQSLESIPLTLRDIVAVMRLTAFLTHDDIFKILLTRSHDVRLYVLTLDDCAENVFDFQHEEKYGSLNATGHPVGGVHIPPAQDLLTNIMKTE